MPSYGWFPRHRYVEGFHLLNWPVLNLHDPEKFSSPAPAAKNTLEFFAWEIDVIRK
jgi:hypothetical protein